MISKIRCYVNQGIKRESHKSSESCVLTVRGFFDTLKAALGRTHIGIYTVLNESFPPQPPPSPLEYIQYSRGHRWLLWRKIFYSKLRSTPKREIFSQDKIKFHGKADACRGILLQYLGKKIRFGAYKSLCESALGCLTFYENILYSIGVLW